MNEIVLYELKSFLQARNYRSGTIANYIRTIQDLPDPPETDDPTLLVEYIDHAVHLKKDLLSKPSFNSARASLNALFRMKTGVQIIDFRRQHPDEDQYSLLMNKFSDYCLSYLHLTGVVTSASIREVRLFLKYAVPDISCVSWTNITANEVIDFLVAERANLNTASIGVTITAIRRFFRFLQHNDYEIHTSILNLPMSVPNWSKGNSLPVVLTPENRAVLDSYVFTETPIGYRDKAVLYCFTELGLRCSEVSNLQLADIKWTQGTIVIRKTKTRAERELPMSVKLGQAMEDYLIYSRPKELGEYLFYKSDRCPNEPASTENIRGIIRRIFSKTNISGWHMGTHALRRSVGSDLYKAGNGLKTVADLLGHSSLAATKAYVKINIDALREVASSWPGGIENE